MDAVAGIWLVLRTPRLWPLCLGPLLTALVVYVLLGVVGGYLLIPRLPGWLGLAPGGRPWWAVEALGTVAFVVLWLFLFSYVFVLLAGLFSGLLWDRLTHAVEMQAGGPTPAASLGCLPSLADSMGRLLLSGALGVGALLLSLFLGPLPGLLAAAFIGLLEYTSSAYLRRGHTLGPQMRRLLGRLDGPTLLFALLAGALSLLPLIGVLLMPGLVVGGTLLTRRREGASPQA